MFDSRRIQELEDKVERLEKIVVLHIDSSLNVLVDFDDGTVFVKTKDTITIPLLDEQESCIVGMYGMTIGYKREMVESFAYFQYEAPQCTRIERRLDGSVKFIIDETTEVTREGKKIIPKK